MEDVPYTHQRAAQAHIQDAVARYGWFIAVRSPDRYRPAVAYTIGLWNNFNHPELIACGLPTEQLHGLLTHLAVLVRDATPLPPEVYLPAVFEHRLVALHQLGTPATWEHLPYAAWYHDYHEFAAIQAVWSGTDGHAEQPLLFDGPQ